MQFNYVNPTRILFGEGEISQLGKELPQDARVLVIYGGGSIKRNGVYEQLQSALSEHQWFEFSGVEPNPTVETLDKAVAKVREHEINYILAVGGGSVIDGSKYVAAAAPYTGNGWDILEGKHTVDQAVPLAAVLTLPATGSESNAGAVITRASTHEKRVFHTPLVQPKFAVLDSSVMATLPERQLINGIVDAFVHVCEQYITYPTQAWVQDGYAEALLKNLLRLGHEYDQRATREWQDNLMWSANQALNGLIGAGVPHDWATHMIGHELTALYGLDHARTLAVVQPALLRQMIHDKREKLAQCGQNVFGLTPGDDLAERTIDAIEDFYHQLGVATTLKGNEIEDPEAKNKILAALEKHGLTALGERQKITLEQSAYIIDGFIS
ncbi:iron-containing alcohol dehydrogenase [Dongshaea marina]|uniref:iron-containing alcohol dehydrogenase n=1 Tax=Dongshaea marina TaxID=2047966 RepID=UPI000D3EA95F|nr:iron-containing alcohol dehydrogenase [Dongshaea marina]